MFPLDYFYYFEIAAFIASVICFLKKPKSKLRWFLPFMLFVLASEFTGRYIRKILHEPNAWFFNISIPVQYCFYLFMFSISFESRRLKKVAMYLLVLLPIFGLANLFFQKPEDVQTYTYIVCFAFVIFTTILFFIELFTVDYIQNPFTKGMFWVATGLLFFSLGLLPYYIFFQYILDHRTDPSAKLYGSIIRILICVLYSFISAGLLISAFKNERRD